MFDYLKYTMFLMIVNNYFQELLEDFDENNVSEARQVRLVTEFYSVFTIGEHLYIDYD